MNTSGRSALPHDVQDNIIENIKHIFPQNISKEVIRSVLIKEDWDLDKGLRLLNSMLNSFDNTNANANAKTKQHNKKKDQPTKSHGPTKYGSSLNKNQAKQDLFKKPPNNKQKKQSSSAQQHGDWVMVNSPGTKSTGAVKKKMPNDALSSPASFEIKQDHSKRLIQSYDIIKHLGDATNRVSACIKEGIRVMILLRGCSGCGKSTYANQLLQKEGSKLPQNHIFSTDLYFTDARGKYTFNGDLLQDAHSWNQKAVQIAAIEGRSPIFVDNTNTRLWEMRDYAIIAVKYGYVLETLEPPTPWFFNEDILCRKTKHSTPRETIRKMLDRYEANLSGEDVIRSLNLSYVPPMVPPQGVSAGLDAPLSKKLFRMIASNVANSSVPSSCKPHSSSVPTKQNFVKIQPSVDSKSQNISDTASFKDNIPFGLFQRKLEIISNDSGNVPALEEPKFPATEVTETPTVIVNEDSVSYRLLESSTSDIEESDDDYEEMTSSKSCSESDEREDENLIDLGNDSKSNLEYVLVTEESNVVFQKEHAILNQIKTLEDFKASSIAEKTIPNKFDDYVMNHLKEPGATFDSGIGACAIGSSSSVELSAQDEASCIPSQSKQTFINEEPAQNISSPNMWMNSTLSSSTNTEHKDFEILKNVNDGESIVRGSVQILEGNAVYTSGPSSVFSSPCSSSAIEKGTTTHDLDTRQITESQSDTAVDKLHKLFPNVSKESLIELFGTLPVDIDWAVGILLDSGAEMIPASTLDQIEHTVSSQKMNKNIASGVIIKESQLYKDIEVPSKNISENIVGASEKINLCSTDSMKWMIDLSSNDNSCATFPQNTTGSLVTLSDEQKVSSDCNNLVSSSENTLKKNSSGNNYFTIMKPTSPSNIMSGTSSKDKPFVGDWDYKKEIPNEQLYGLPKIQREPRNKFLKKPCLSIATNTNYVDFENLRSVNKGHIVNDVKTLIGSPCFVSGQSPISHFSSVLMLDKGTMTTDFETNHIEVRDSGIEKLALMFPMISRENLEELFDKCHRDIDWAVGLLLDSGQEISELYTSLEASEEPQGVEEPCQSDAANDDSNADINIKSEEKPQKRKRRIRQSKSDNVLYKEMEEQFQNSFVLNESHYTSEKMKKYFKKRNPGLSNNENESVSPPPEQTDDDNLSDNSDSEDIVFMLDSDFILQLQTRFGGLLRPNMIAGKTVVNLPLSLARQLHSYVMDSIHEHLEEEDVFTDEDEAYARHLQEEENRSRGAPSLQEIMDEEVAIRKSQKDLASGRSMASALSKQLLLERFPKMDPSTLSSILEDTNHSLHQATTLLSFAGHSQAEETEQDQATTTEVSEEASSLSRQEAIKQANAYGDVASQLYELRKDCLRKSQKAYRDGNHAVAYYYSDMARWYMERIEKSNSMAAKAILTGYEGWTTLDLHFLQVSEALNVLDLFVDEVIRSLQDSKERKAVVYVITGRGLHSTGGRPKLKPAVQTRLKKRELEYSEQNPGMLKVIIPRKALTSYSQQVEATS